MTLMPDAFSMWAWAAFLKNSTAGGKSCTHIEIWVSPSPMISGCGVGATVGSAAGATVGSAVGAAAGAAVGAAAAPEAAVGAWAGAGLPPHAARRLVAEVAKIILRNLRRLR